MLRVLEWADFCVHCVVVVPVKLRAVLNPATSEALTTHKFLWFKFWALLTGVIALPGMVDIAWSMNNRGKKKLIQFCVGIQAHIYPAMLLFTCAWQFPLQSQAQLAQKSPEGFYITKNFQYITETLAGAGGALQNPAEQFPKRFVSSHSYRK